ncbi:MAG: oligopeptide transport system ATP-binding protein [Gaiellaceae bacterium]|nr:oligopeptide transport system ATP-binding protein [Gaiellaceae bacterium]
MQAERLLEVRGLKVQFATEDGLVRAVDGIDFELDRGQVLGIVGESGSGKSVTAMTMLGLTRDQNTRFEGEVVYKGRNILELSEEELRQYRGAELAMIFQDPMTSLNPVYKVGDQIVEMIRAHERIGKRNAKNRATDLLKQVGIPNPERRVDDYPHQFSGGMRQRAMIAMALATEPKLLIADEPTTALDVTIQAQILDLLRGLVVDRDTALILITHDLGVVAGMCERVNVMYAGMFMETGSAEQLFGTPRHPYTLGLLQSVPRLDAARKAKLHPIEGSPRNMLEPPHACPFQPRCRFEVDLSRQEVPPLVEIEPGHKVACFNPVPADEWARERAGAVA